MKPTKLSIVMLPIEEIKPTDGNERLHQDTNLEILRKGLEDFDQQKPIVIDKDKNIIAGHGIWMAAKAAGYTHWNCSISKLKGNKKKAYRIFDNKSGELSKWDDEKLSKTLYELHSDGYNVADYGFEKNDYDWSKDPEKDEKEDDIPEVEENVFGVKRGDIYQLDDHRLMCGDSTDKGDVDKLMDGEKADMVFTDPPYGMNLDTDYSKMPEGKKYSKIINDDYNFNAEFILEYYCYVKDIFLFGGDYYAHSIPQNSGSWIVWDKFNADRNENRIGSGFELCWSKNRHKRIICRIAQLFGPQAKDRTHPTQKPISLAEWFFDKWGKDKNLIVDLFLGSGSTLIACEKTNRKCYGMEIDPHYCSIIIKRWEEYSDKKHVKL